MAKIEIASSISHLVFRVERWVKKHPFETVLLISIILVGAFLRLYKIDQYMTFLGDEGRDVIIVRRLWVEHHPPLIGPGTSIGNMYLGPLYYYMMAIPLLIANYSPVGPAVMVALLGIATIFLVWWVAREWFGPIAAFFAAFFYAISPTVIIYSRSSWNPNIMPFFALSSIYLMWRVWSKKELRSLILAGISFAFVVQSHYLGIALIPVMGILWLLTFWQARRDTKTKRKLIVNTLLGVIAFAILMSPLLIFDIRHNWQNFNAVKQFFTVRQDTVSIRPWNAIPKMYPRFEDINTRLIAGRDVEVGKWTTIIVTGFSAFLVITKRKKLGSSFYLLIIWLGFALLGLGLYKQNIFDHYYGFIFVVPFILTGAIYQKLYKNNIVKMFLVIGFLILAYANFSNSALNVGPNNQLKRSQDIAAFIMGKAMGQRFNIATISERNNRDVYQYFFQVWGAKVVDTDPNAVKYTVTDQLFVVCEKPKEKCDPTHDPSAWIANFGWSKILDQWEVSGVIIYKLGHTK